MIVNYPEGLPYPLKEGNSHEPVQTFIRSELTTGRAIQRRKYSGVPEYVNVYWQFSDSEAQLFMSWFRDDLNDGASWFKFPTRTPSGTMEYVARFMQMYTYTISGCGWQYRARIELRERPILLPHGWGKYAPEYILHSDLLDIAMNQKWPAA